jgi:GT2 family glycosyltransferase
MKPLVSVVVCTFNDENTIDSVLSGIQGLSYRPLEIIVIDDASTDRTPEIIRRSSVNSLQNPENRGLGYSQNLGLRTARGEYLALIQSDCVVSDPDWLDQMMELMEERVGAIVSQRRIRNFADLPAGARFFNAVAPQDIENLSGEPVEIQYCRGKADLYRTSILRQLNGWNTRFFTAGEDTDLSIRLRHAGYKIFLHPKATVEYLFSGRQTSVQGALKKAFLYGQVAFPLYQLHGYDGIQSRSYMVFFASMISVALPLIPQFVIGPALFIYSWTCKIQTTRGINIPYGLLASISSVPLLMLDSADHSRHLTTIPARSLFVAGLAYTVFLAAKNTLRNYRKGERGSRLPETYLFCFSWRLISGLGYLAAMLQSLRKDRRKSATLENHESLVD